MVLIFGSLICLFGFLIWYLSLNVRDCLIKYKKYRIYKKTVMTPEFFRSYSFSEEVETNELVQNVYNGITHFTVKIYCGRFLGIFPIWIPLRCEGDGNFGNILYIHSYGGIEPFLKKYIENRELDEFKTIKDRVSFMGLKLICNYYMSISNKNSYRFLKSKVSIEEEFYNNEEKILSTN